MAVSLVHILLFAKPRAEQPRRDSTVATVFRVDLATVEHPLIAFPTYHVVDRHGWTGVKHATVYAALLDLVRQWRAWYLVVDATGVGAGLASFLVKKLGRPATVNPCPARPARADDMLVSATLVSVLDGMEWRVEVEGR